MKRMKRTVPAIAAAVALLAAGVAVAATPGTYEGWLYKGKGNGKRVPGSLSLLTVSEQGERGQIFRLSVYNMPLACPYLDDNGDPARARFRFIHRGFVEGDFIDDTRQYPRTNPSHVVRIRGRFDGNTFRGRVTVRAAAQIVGACTGTARIRVRGWPELNSRVASGPARAAPARGDVRVVKGDGL